MIFIIITSFKTKKKTLDTGGTDTNTFTKIKNGIYTKLCKIPWTLHNHRSTSNKRRGSCKLFQQLKFQNKVCFSETFLGNDNNLLSTLSEINLPWTSDRQTRTMVDAERVLMQRNRRNAIDGGRENKVLSSKTVWTV